jgi:hypothetical protein
MQLIIVFIPDRVISKCVVVCDNRMSESSRLQVIVERVERVSRVSA